MTELYRVAYRKGGLQNFEWHLTMPVETLGEANQMLFDCQRMGYDAAIETDAFWKVAGKPTTWSYALWRDSKQTPVERAMAHKTQILAVLQVAGIDLTNVTINVGVAA